MYFSLIIEKFCFFSLLKKNKKKVETKKRIKKIQCNKKV